MDNELIRHCIFKPYRKQGPHYHLYLYDTGKVDHLSKYRLAYKLVEVEGRAKCVLFEGEDFCCSPLNAIDSDATVAALMAFLTMRPGDTDAEYFAGYSNAQLDYCASHAESLQLEVTGRFEV